MTHPVLVTGTLCNGGKPSIFQPKNTFCEKKLFGGLILAVHSVTYDRIWLCIDWIDRHGISLRERVERDTYKLVPESHYSMMQKPQK